MAKNCYVVMNINSNQVVSDIKNDFWGKILYRKNLLTVSTFGQFDTLKQARLYRNKHGGVILRAIP